MELLLGLLILAIFALGAWAMITRKLPALIVLHGRLLAAWHRDLAATGALLAALGYRADNSLAAEQALVWRLAEDEDDGDAPE